jgi:hypothetical protein
MSSQPKYWDANKGKVLYAIYKSQNRTFPELLTLTNFQDLELRLVLKELFDEELVSKNGESYWIEDYELYCEYRDYDNSINLEASMTQKKDAQIKILKEKWAPIKIYLEEKQNSPRIVKGILAWTILQGINFDPWSEHFFVNGDLLDQISKSIIEQSQSSVLIINPFVDQCSLSDRLKNINTNGKEVQLLTRSPRCESYSKTRKARGAYHDALVRSGVEILYNDRIHSKIIIGDVTCGVVSSMNFKSESSSGKNLEAGLVTWQKDTITSLKEYATDLMKDPETTPYDG